MIQRIVAVLGMIALFAIQANALTSMGFTLQDETTLGEGAQFQLTMGPLVNPPYQSPVTNWQDCRIEIDSLNSPDIIYSLNVGNYSIGQTIPPITGTLFAPNVTNYTISAYLHCYNYQNVYASGRPFELMSDTAVQTLRVDNITNCVPTPRQIEILNITDQNTYYDVMTKYSNNACKSLDASTDFMVGGKLIQRVIYYDKILPEQTSNIIEKIQKFPFDDK